MFVSLTTLIGAIYIGFSTQEWKVAIGFIALSCLGILAARKTSTKSCKTTPAIIAASASTTFSGDGN